MSAKKLRCAIYTRKSSEEGLDQAFNSLDAQREACGAYILSQAGEGWSAVRDVYDDGGFSGGSMERPALQRLLSDIEAGRLDVVVVYKVDRLTRSLADFARIVEIFDRTGASFVSVTQAFNTTTSMGRLTLNVLLSFAQFEREVTGERIRDKVAASKAKGMWMGGHPPLGYDVRNRELHVNAEEAETVRLIFRRYLEVRSVVDLRDALANEGVRSKCWTTQAGKQVGGCKFTHGALFHILSNRVYLGQIVHRGKVYPGRHAAIIEPELFDAVAKKLKAGAPPLPGRSIRGYAAPLLGKVFDDSGSPMTSAHGNKHARRYHYYVSTAHCVKKPAGSLPRVSAPQLHQATIDLVTPCLRDAWKPDEVEAARVFSAVRRIVLSRHEIRIEAEPAALQPTALGNDAKLEQRVEHWMLTAPISLSRPFHAHRMLSASLAKTPPRVDRALVRAVVMSRHWAHVLATGEAASIQAIAEREQLCPIYTGQLLPLAFMAPDLAEAILDGRQPAGLTLGALLEAPLPRTWAAQRTHFSAFA